MKNKPAFWIVQRESDSAFLCRDGCWRHFVTGVEDFKTYRTDWRAIHYGLKYQDGTAFALYPEDFIGRDGNITRHADHFANVSSIQHR